MSGHSKWSTIKRKKAATDAKRGKMYTRLLKEIQVAAKIGGGSLDGNARLKTAVLAAKSVSVPADNIERAIKRGAGQSEGADLDEVTYEGFGPGGVALLIKALTDNKNRTVAEIRSALARYNGSLGSANSVARIFQERGVIEVSKSSCQESELMDLAIGAGALDVSDEGYAWFVSSEPRDYPSVYSAIERTCAGLEGAIRSVPVSTVPVSGAAAATLMKLLDVLDDLDDVQSVSANFEIEADELERLQARSES